MKYFTPELLAECRSLNPDIAEAAAARWQARADAYRKRLREIQPCLPLGVRKLIRSITLHDASLLSINQGKVGGRTQFFVSFRLADSHRRAGVQLRYDLVKPLKVILHDPNLSGDSHMFALYSEFDAPARGTFTHSILMTRGVELRMRFTNLVFTPFTQVLAPALARSDMEALMAIS